MRSRSACRGAWRIKSVGYGKLGLMTEVEVEDEVDGERLSVWCSKAEKLAAG